MNRIYQGRVSKVEIPTGNKDNPWQPLDSDPKIAREKWQALLWRHHETLPDFAHFTTQCNEQALVGDTTFFGQFLQPAKR